MPALSQTRVDYTEVSPSALNLAKLCFARAVAHYGHGIRDTFGAAAKKGVENHKIAQHYLITGEPPKRSNVAVTKLLSVLPLTAGSVEPHNIERVLLLPGYHGFMDWEHERRDYFASFADRVGYFGDLKFTSDLKWIASKEPSTDPQRLIYSADWLRRNPGASHVTSVWTASRFDGAAAKNFPWTASRDFIRQRMTEQVEPLAQKLRDAVASGVDWQTQPKDFSACTAYRPKGCPAQKTCKRSMSERLSSIVPKQRLALIK